MDYLKFQHGWIITCPVKCMMKSLIPFLSLIYSHTSMVQLLKFGNGKVISGHTLFWMYYSSMLEFRLIHVSKWAPVNKEPRLQMINSWVFFFHFNMLILLISSSNEFLKWLLIISSYLSLFHGDVDLIFAQSSRFWTRWVKDCSKYSLLGLKSQLGSVMAWC